MIITKQKPVKEMLLSLKDSKKLFLVGCAQCATACKSGGEEELEAMERILKKEGKKITGKAVLDPACHLTKVKQFFHRNKDAITASDAMLSMACGDGAQSLMDGTKGGRVFPALDTLFLGEVERSGHFLQKCILCGDCVLDKTGSICPVTICTKGLLNGPCGGSKREKCEVDRERDCGWILIYKRLKDIGEIDKMKRFIKPKDHSREMKPQKLVVK